MTFRGAFKLEILLNSFRGMPIDVIVIIMAMVR
jgi:hypothetical protein